MHFKPLKSLRRDEAPKSTAHEAYTNICVKPLTGLLKRIINVPSIEAQIGGWENLENIRDYFNFSTQMGTDFKA